MKSNKIICLATKKPSALFPLYRYCFYGQDPNFFLLKPKLMIYGDFLDFDCAESLWFRGLSSRWLYLYVPGMTTYSVVVIILLPFSVTNSSADCCFSLYFTFCMQSMIVFIKPIKFALLFTFGNMLAIGRYATICLVIEI